MTPSKPPSTVRSSTIACCSTAGEGTGLSVLFGLCSPDPGCKCSCSCPFADEGAFFFFFFPLALFGRSFDMGTAREVSSLYPGFSTRFFGENASRIADRELV